MTPYVTPARIRRLSLIGAFNAGLVALLYALEPSLLTDTARSPRALAIVGLTVLAAMVLGRIGRRYAGSVGGAVGAVIPLALVGWLVIAPAVRDVTLVEPLPAGIAALATDEAPSSAGSTEVPAPSVTPVTPAAVDAAPRSKRSSSPAAAAPRPAVESRRPAVTNRASGTPQAALPSRRPAPASAPAPRGPAKVSSGRVQGINHTASGTVAVYRLEDGSHIVRFEDVALEGAPDPVLWLVPGRDQRSRDGGLEVAPLKATHGSFHHAVPQSFDVTQDFTVFIWCERYATPIANATQNRL
ncbi:MAG TPA: DM13 domain-containing protein [Mycobacteriales bacterium]|nr:DM13 domain-containing protein [Mycobacteriales bacterium]